MVEKKYKMHVRVLLSRYRAYTTCPSCHGGRFQPETLNYRLVTGDEIAFTLPEFAALPITQAREFLTSLVLSPNDSAAAMLRRDRSGLTGRSRCKAVMRVERAPPVSSRMPALLAEPSSSKILSPSVLSSQPRTSAITTNTPSSTHRRSSPAAA